MTGGINDYTTFNKEEQVPKKSKVDHPAHDCNVGGGGSTAEGVPVGHGVVVGEPVVRSQWNTSLFACLGHRDEFFTRDLLICLLGSLAPCVLYGSNVESLGEDFVDHYCCYSCLYLLGNSLFASNILAPFLSHLSRTAIRRRFNLEGSFEAFSRSCCGCCRGMVEDEVRREECETTCDFLIHVIFHNCALCQEGRELCHRLPHHGFNGRPVRVMFPPAEQTMERGGV